MCLDKICKGSSSFFGCNQHRGFQFFKVSYNAAELRYLFSEEFSEKSGTKIILTRDEVKIEIQKRLESGEIYKYVIEEKIIVNTKKYFYPPDSPRQEFYFFTKKNTPALDKDFWKQKNMTLSGYYFQ